jgi:hypothetical protein
MKIFTDRFGVNAEIFTGAPDQFTGLRRAKRPAAGQDQDGLQDTGFTGAVAAEYNVKPGVGQDVYLL